MPKRIPASFVMAGNLQISYFVSITVDVYADCFLSFFVVTITKVMLIALARDSAIIC